MQHNSELLLLLHWANRHNAKPHVRCSIYCHFKNSSSVISLFNNTPVLFPVDTAYDTARIGLVLSPQAYILSTVVFWKASTLISPCSVNSQPNNSGILQCCSKGGLE